MQITKNVELKAGTPKIMPRPFTDRFVGQVINDAIVDFHKSHKVGEGYPPSMSCPMGKVTYSNIAKIAQYCQKSNMCTFTKMETQYTMDLTPGIPKEKYWDYPSAALESFDRMLPKFVAFDPSFKNCNISH